MELLEDEDKSEGHQVQIKEILFLTDPLSAPLQIPSFLLGKIRPVTQQVFLDKEWSLLRAFIYYLVTFCCGY